MWRYNNQFMVNPPTNVVVDGFNKKFVDVLKQDGGRNTLDILGYNEAVPLKREAYTEYETRWVKDEDLIVREESISSVVNEEARAEVAATLIRAERDQRLAASDWTQLVDSILDDEGMVLWQSYRQALRDVPQQEEFPDMVVWPEEPVMD